MLGIDFFDQLVHTWHKFLLPMEPSTVVHLLVVLVRVYLRFVCSKQLWLQGSLYPGE